MKTHWHGGSETELKRWLRGCFNNNYRKLHGKHMRRWVNERRTADKESLSLYRKNRKGD